MPELADVLVGTRNVAETNFAFDPQTGLLAVMEMTVDSDADPCELRLSDYRDVGGRQVPHQVEVRQGDRVSASFSGRRSSWRPPRRPSHEPLVRIR